jgi:hypothetical protein
MLLSLDNLIPSNDSPLSLFRSPVSLLSLKNKVNEHTKGDNEARKIKYLFKNKLKVDRKPPRLVHI